MNGCCEECHKIDKEIQYKVSSNPLGYNELLDRMDYRDVYFFCSRECLEDKLQSDPDV